MAWRHPRPQGAQGRCIGHTDLPLDRRKAKRLAHRIRQAARRHGWPHVVYTSPLRRCADVGRCLRRWGWQHRVDAALLEMDFGRWDGLPWQHIPLAEIDAWCDDLRGHAPGGGESLLHMAERVRAHGLAWMSERAMTPGDAPQPLPPRLVVAHAGWMLLWRWLAEHPELPRQAAHWPAPPAYGQCWALACAQ